MKVHQKFIVSVLCASSLAPIVVVEAAVNPSSLITLFAAKECPNTTPTGTVKPKKGTFKGKTIKFEDPRGKHTCFYNKKQSELEALVKNPDPKSKLEQQFSESFKNKDGNPFGSQLNKEMVENYATALTEALENGQYNVDKKKVYYTFSDKVGADNSAGKFTKNVRVDSLSINEDISNGVHMFPFD